VRVPRLLLLALFACSAAVVSVSCSTSPGAVAKADVEKQVSDQLTKSSGSKPDSITCPGDLTATVGTTMRCTLAAGGTTIGLTVTVNSVDSGSGNVKFDIKVDDAVTATTAATTTAP